MKRFQLFNLALLLAAILCMPDSRALADASSLSAGGVCQVGDVIAPGESCTYPGTDAEFSVLSNGSGHFLFSTAGTRLVIKNTTINGQSYTLVAGKLASGSWEIEELADSGNTPVTTYIPDANLRAKIESALGKTSGDPISAAEMATLTSLSAQDASISDLTGLETATNLTELQLWDNNISDIAAVASLTKLTRLYLWGNAITDISAVAGLTNLTHLRLSENSIANVSAVAGLTNLTHLYLRENSISDIAAVAGLTKLTELRIGDNTISNIAAVASLTKLVWLDAPNNSISDMAAVANLTNLTSLSLSGNSISDLSAVAGLTNLIELYLAENSVSDLSPLVANMGLGANTEIDVQGNPLSYPSIYTHIPALQARSVFMEFDNRTPTTLAKISGDSQQGTPGTALAQPFVVEVQDGESAAFAGVPVTFAVTAGGGTLSATSTTTDANGQAQSTLTLGNNAGTNTVQVSVQSIAQSETFTAEATEAIDDTSVVSALTPVSARTPQVRDAIVTAAGVNSATDVTDGHLAAITSIYLIRDNITTLKTGDFDGLTALTTLDLAENQLSMLPEDIFDDLTALTQLDLHDNQLSTLPEDIFDGLTALTELDLGVNQLTTLPAGIFNNLSALTWFALARNQLSLLPAGIFDNLTTLTTLYLYGNQLSSLPAGIFDNLSALTYLDLGRKQALSGNQLSSLPAGIFDGLTALTYLSLEGNSVDPLPLTVSLEKVGEGQFKAVAPSGAPFDIVLPVSIINGSISGGATTLTISKGSVESQTLTVTRTTGTTAAVTSDIGDPLPSLPSGHGGYALVKSTDLPLEIVSSGITGLTTAATDFNGDGRTDFVDFFLFADAYGGTDARFDLDGNGMVDFADFFKFVDAFGS